MSDSLRQADLKALIKHADETFASTSEIFDKINQGEGTAGQLMVNDSLYNNLNSALASLDSLLIDLREHPNDMFIFPFSAKKINKDYLIRQASQKGVINNKKKRPEILFRIILM